MQSPSSFSTPPFLGQGVWGVENGWDGWQNMGVTIFKEMHSLFSLFKEKCHQWKQLLLPHIWMSEQSTGPRTGRVEYPMYIPRIGGGWFGAWAKKLLHTFVGSCYVLETALVCSTFNICCLIGQTCWTSTRKIGSLICLDKRYGNNKPKSWLGTGMEAKDFWQVPVNRNPLCIWPPMSVKVIQDYCIGHTLGTWTLKERIVWEA